MSRWLPLAALALLTGCESTSHMLLDTQISLATERGTAEQMLLEHHLPVRDARRIGATLKRLELQAQNGFKHHDKGALIAAKQGLAVEGAYLKARLGAIH